jgi:hypothetical protein
MIHIKLDLLSYEMFLKSKTRFVSKLPDESWADCEASKWHKTRVTTNLWKA